MLTYTLEKAASESLYEQLYDRIKAIFSPGGCRGGEASLKADPGPAPGGEHHHGEERL